MTDILIYGATGYTGKLCAQAMLKRNLTPILAGRSESVRSLAERLGCPAKIFALTDDLSPVLADITLVVNLAGPFEITQSPLIQACIASGCHYLDIAGEVREMQSAYTFDPAARAAGVMLMPGAGFGVVPTDIAARLAKDQLPNATDLKILYATEGGASRGTLSTVLRQIDQPGFRRVAGELRPALPAESQMEFEVAGHRFTGVYNPWRADLFTAALSTGIANIETFTAFPGFVVSMMQGKRLWLRDLILNRLLQYLPEGPSLKQLQRGYTYIKAIATNDTEQREVTLKGPEAYLFTAQSVTEIAVRILRGEVTPGFQTPSFYGKDLLDGIAGIELVFRQKIDDR
jgi:short subunit dehydrogenase-like uncharacterized protein